MVRITAVPDSMLGNTRGGRALMDPKILFMFALLAPILILAAGIFASRKTSGDDVGNAKPEPNPRGFSAV